LLLGIRAVFAAITAAWLLLVDGELRIKIAFVP
jgi:hypothetical protein